MSAEQHGVTGEELQNKVIPVPRNQSQPLSITHFSLTFSPWNPGQLITFAPSSKAQFGGFSLPSDQLIIFIWQIADCSMCSACSRALEHPRAAVSATTHHPWKLCQWGFSALLCSAVGGSCCFASDNHAAPGYIFLLQLEFHHSDVLGVEGSTLTEPLNPQIKIHDHSFKQLRKENK